MRVTDAAGNSSSANTSVTVDTQAPIVTVAPVANPTANNRPPVTFTVSGGNGAQCSIDGGAFATCTSTFIPASPLPDGYHTIVVRSTDAAGNTGSGSTAFTVDTTPPDTAFASVEPSPTNDSTGEFQFSSSDGGSDVPLSHRRCGVRGVPCELHDCRARGWLAHARRPRRRRRRQPGSDARVAHVARRHLASEHHVRRCRAEPDERRDGRLRVHVDATRLDVRMLARRRDVRDLLDPVRDAGVDRRQPHARRPRHRHGEQRGSTPASHTWLVDARPPATTIATFPSNPTNDPSGSFTFTSDEPATFQCSLDGATFAACAASFTTPSLGNGAHTIAVRARDNAGNFDATPATYGWTVDTSPPTTTIASAEPSPTNDPTGDFTFTSNESATFECAVDGSAFAACSASFSTASLADGTHTLSVRARDAANNVDATPASHGWTVDTGPPETTIGAAEPSPTSDPTGDFTFTSSEAGSTFQCQLDGGTFAACTTPYSTAALPDGSHTFAVRATDPAGNVDASPDTHTWTVDALPPETTITAAEPDPSSDTTGDFTFSSNDAAATFQCSVDGATFTTCTTPFATAVLANGPHTFAVRARDAAGNFDPTPDSHAWSVDVSPPDTTIGAAEPTPTNDPTGDFTFTSNDAAATFQCSVDGAAFTACTTPFATASLGDGAHTFAVRARDVAGNLDPFPDTHSWTVDTAPPDTTIGAAEPDPTTDPTGDFTFTATQTGSTFQCSVDGAAFTTCTTPFATAALGDGDHTFAVRAIDPAGNTDPTPDSHAWTIDTAPPDTTIGAAEPNPTNDPTADFTFSSNDATATFECSVNGAAFTACTTPFSTTSLSQGNHTFAVRARDPIGNLDPTPDTHAWTLDTTAPNVTITPAPPSPTNDTTPNTGFTVTGTYATLLCRVDTQPFTSCTTPHYTTPVLGNGPHTVFIQATDAAGNSDTESVTFVVDTTPPTVSITDGSGPTLDDPQQFSFVHSADAVRIECSVDFEPFVDCTSPYDGPAFDGVPGFHTFEVRVTDDAGNEATDSTDYELEPTVECLDGSDNLGTDDVTGNVEDQLDVTVEFWFLGRSLQTGALFGLDVPAQGQTTPYVSFSYDAGRFRLYLSVAGGGLREFTAPAGFEVNDWHHYAIIVDGTQRLFIDGVEVAGVQQFGSPAITFADVFSGVTDPVNLYAGGDGWGNQRASGGFRDFRLSRRALYNATFLPPFTTPVTADSVLHYPMNEGEGDFSSNIMGTSPGMSWGFSSWSSCINRGNF